MLRVGSCWLQHTHTLTGKGNAYGGRGGEVTQGVSDATTRSRTDRERQCGGLLWWGRCHVCVCGPHKREALYGSSATTVGTADGWSGHGPSSFPSFWPRDPPSDLSDLRDMCMLACSKRTALTVQDLLLRRMVGGVGDAGLREKQRGLCSQLCREPSVGGASFHAVRNSTSVAPSGYFRLPLPRRTVLATSRWPPCLVWEAG